ncbi:GNAT family N-acetyltransferase [Pukyongiella litopenaei]|uniref:GNAT family N-acetyltransferase n=1 Tax=Pukyongiella litopenaei TaxID=2605946 RepID=A0A2S0MLS6_9RHOB|nr:GNAT family N-acetyltransferase [Pukyongiella litopenaei]AVO36838.1 GNAT family N-acetyltransferase [Pukyongiella litopenaei]
MTPRLADTPVLETERLILRAPGPQDWPAWRAMMASDRSRYIRSGDMDDGKAWRAFGHVIGHWVLREWGNFVFTARGDDTALGMAGPWFPEGWPEREIGWSVWTPQAEGKGFAFEAATAARGYAYDVLGWDTAVSYIDPANARSIALAERLGAVRDPQAAAPGDAPCLVYRHPGADRLADGGMEAYA